MHIEPVGSGVSPERLGSEINQRSDQLSQFDRAAGPSGWYPDPWHVFALRWYDGMDWTSWTSDEYGLSPASAVHRSVGLNRRDECELRGDGTWSCWPASAQDASLGPDTPTDRELEVFRIAAEHFRHDLVALWNHSSYFLIIQGALFSVFASVIGPPNAATKSGIVSATGAALFLAVVGLVFGLFWSWVSWRRNELIKLWRQNVTHLDGRVDRHGIYLRVEPMVGERWWRGPSSFTSRLPLVVCVIWVVAIVWTLRSS